ncbi:helix-turn-helix domain-containing protein [Rickettsiales endosymbiont of Stachyamoeba lipophora]|uniref:helix-turn-helix domain-containing protein n=1 Tax=Rickettsiales endosymbiont of Stachyamoeba lipophora TaxID=2486578 RepID=UPI000F6454B6|nr:helix-turn-helix transcriptional regulator [Rickettsiales endosymbiont of Stachyamoeba lipophora]AZL14992.1 XRE family transcriptional regulator [Rickettsiales endosymbiont of Stachyamoeba lipophora]
MQNIDKTIGQNIRILRNKSGFSQEELGKRCGVTFQQIQKYEKGLNKVSASRLLMLAEILNCKFEDFFIEEEDRLIEISSLYASEDQAKFNTNIIDPLDTSKEEYIEKIIKLLRSVNDHKKIKKIYNIIHAFIN